MESSFRYTRRYSDTEEISVVSAVGCVWLQREKVSTWEVRSSEARILEINSAQNNKRL